MFQKLLFALSFLITLITQPWCEGGNITCCEISCPVSSWCHGSFICSGIINIKKVLGKLLFVASTPPHPHPRLGPGQQGGAVAGCQACQEVKLVAHTSVFSSSKLLQLSTSCSFQQIASSWRFPLPTSCGAQPVSNRAKGRQGKESGPALENKPCLALRALRPQPRPLSWNRWCHRGGLVDY